MLLSAPVISEVPNGLDPRHAALTEPTAVDLRAVNESRIEPPEGALVLGCGPVGLAVVTALRLGGVETIVASDFSPTRRALATTMGASEVVDPAAEPAFDAWQPPAVAGSSSSSRPSACRGSSRASSGTRRRRRGWSSSACAWKRTGSTPSPLITGEVGLDGVADAFDALGDPDEHCKILVVP
jgi:threonine dehydrogenase-like Zn-dependent dehydrogenase